MYHFSIEFLELAVSCLGLGEGGCDRFVVTNHSASKISRLRVPEVSKLSDHDPIIADFDFCNKALVSSDFILIWTHS